MNIDGVAVGAASGVVGAVVGVLGLFVARHGARVDLMERVTRAEEGVESAVRTSAEVDNDMKTLSGKHSAEVRELHTRIEAANAAWNMKWETALRDFASHETIRDMERRLMEASGASEKRILDAMRDLVRRVDNVMDGRKGE